MKPYTKDTSYCMRKGHGHIVPRSEMTTMLNDNGKWIRICVGCKAEAMDRRAEKRGGK